MTGKTDHGGRSTHPRSDFSQVQFRQPPWNEKLALILIANETTWPACLFILDLLMQQIIKFEKQEDHTTTSKASPMMKSLTGDADDFRFYHYFDLVGGTAIGGLLAIMLGHLRLPLEETSKTLSEVLGSTCSERSSRQEYYARQIHAKLHDKLEPETLRSSLRTCASAQDICRENASKFESIPGMCQTLVFVARKTSPSKVSTLKSYRQPGFADKDYKRSDDNTIRPSLVNVCRVSVANLSDHEYVNIRLDATKPAEGMVGTPAKSVDYQSLIEEEIKLLHHETSSLQCFLEIGSQPKKPASWWRSCLPFKQTRSEHLEMEGPVSPEGQQQFRVSGLEKLAIHLRNLSKAEAERYCLEQGLYEQLENCARVLVKARRARASTFIWETFAFSDRYSCSVCRKEGRDTGILDVSAFFDHVDFVHNFYNLSPPYMFEIQNESWMEL